MYETLVAALRNVSEYDSGYAKLMYDAADAIEALSKTEKTTKPHGRLIDADKIGLTDFEIILCQKENPFKNALEMLLEKIENAPTVIQASGKDTDVPTREEGV